MVEVLASGQCQLNKELRQRIELFEGVNQRCLLPVGKELQIDAQAFFNFIGLSQEVALKLQLQLQVVVAFHGCGSRTTE